MNSVDVQLCWHDDGDTEVHQISQSANLVVGTDGWWVTLMRVVASARWNGAVVVTNFHVKCAHVLTRDVLRKHERACT